MEKGGEGEGGGEEEEEEVEEEEEGILMSFILVLEIWNNVAGLCSSVLSLSISPLSLLFISPVFIHQSCLYSSVLSLFHQTYFLI